jgi:pimeloyl-CoA synthetase
MKDPHVPVDFDRVENKKDFLVKMMNAIEEEGTLLSRITVRDTHFKPIEETKKAMAYMSTHALCQRYDCDFYEVVNKAYEYLCNVVAGGGFRPFTLTEVNCHKYPNYYFIASYMTLSMLSEMVVE